MPKILDYNSFCDNLDEVTSLKTFGIHVNVVDIMEFHKLVIFVIYVK